jgi:hypothetical protein
LATLSKRTAVRGGRGELAEVAAGRAGERLGRHGTDESWSRPQSKAFVAGIADRCDVSPVAAGATLVGGYR